MFDPLSLVVGATLFGAGWLIGRTRRRHSQPKPPICACGHGLAMHNRDTGVCHDEVSRNVFDRRGLTVGKTFVPCRCQRYVGPEHVLDVWTPPPAAGPPPLPEGN